MAKKKKWYVVWEGHRPGIYDTWQECQVQIKDFPLAKYKSFSSEEEAIEAYTGNYRDYIGKDKKKEGGNRNLEKVTYPSLSVDAACAGNPGLMEYRGVDTSSKREIFHKGPFPQGTNNIGEFLALVHALALLHMKGDSSTPIYSDSRTAMAWVRNKKVKTTLTMTSENEILFNLINRAIAWLKTHDFDNPILKWETKEWGEIPADFGRK